MTLISFIRFHFGFVLSLSFSALLLLWLLWLFMYSKLRPLLSPYRNRQKINSNTYILCIECTNMNTKTKNINDMKRNEKWIYNLLNVCFLLLLLLLLLLLFSHFYGLHPCVDSLFYGLWCIFVFEYVMLNEQCSMLNAHAFIILPEWRKIEKLKEEKWTENWNWKLCMYIFDCQDIQNVNHVCASGQNICQWFFKWNFIHGSDIAVSFI